MAAPLSTCTKIEQCGVVRFLWAKNMEAKDIHKEMLPMYGEHCLSRQAVHNCCAEVLGRADKYRRRTSSRSDYVPTATKRIFRRRFPGTCETVGQVFVCMEIMLRNKCCLYVIISIRFFSITICNLLIEFLSY